jgi:hypothetical protein
LFEKTVCRGGESAAFVGTMAGGNNNAILEIEGNLIGSLYRVENHRQCLGKKNE